MIISRRIFENIFKGLRVSNECEDQIKILKELLILDTTMPVDETVLNCIIFSCDRAMQLHALLSSYYEKVSDPVPVYIIYRSSSNRHERSYNELFKDFSERNIIPVKQGSAKTFKDILLSVLSQIQYGRVFFLVDDVVFIENVTLKEFMKYDSRYYIPSLRLGKNITYAYTTNSYQEIPECENVKLSEVSVFCWRWCTGTCDWGYPLSLDGNLYSVHEILALTKAIDFNSPNTYESHLQGYKWLFDHRYGICFKKSVIVNIPLNRVQSDFNNTHGEIHQDYLLSKWEDGVRIDYRKLYGFNNIGVHQEIPIHFI